MPDKFITQQQAAINEAHVNHHDSPALERFAKEHVAEIREIVGSIYGLTRILEEDATRSVSEGPESVLGPFEMGSINTAITHLAQRADALAEAIEERES